jgi:AcrR family transcriptional regulator
MDDPEPCLSEYSLSYSVPVITKHHRAKPLPPAQRKQAIVDAVIPLLLDKGSAVTSRQMAEAAGIAEGTIFRVFPDKPSVIKEAVKTSMDPAPLCDALARISESASMDAQLETAAKTLLEHSERVAALMGVLRTAHSSASERPAGIPRFVRESNTAILSELTKLFERHADRLRIEPTRAAIAFRGLIFANAHPMVAPNERTTPQEIVDLLLRGLSN